ncbi:MAG TPA: TIGR03118 family protein [Nevskia sp.]|nr:TIGR03118 family protein [Nevskia sp.]
MRPSPTWPAMLAAGVLLAACNSSNMGTTQNGFSATRLVSDKAAIAAAHNDANLVNAWGIAFEPAGPVWVANNGTQTSTLYDGSGAAQTLVVTVASGLNGDPDPTGIVFNGSADFVVSGGGHSGAAQFIYDGEGGTVSGWSPAVGNTTVIGYDDGAGGAVYKGLAIANTPGGNFLYAADFHNAKVDVFDKDFHKVAMPGGFTDPALPANYAPFGIQAVGGSIVVTFAEQQLPDKHDEVDGAGLGVVDIFDTSGHMLGGREFVAPGGALNAPWGVALAPADFGAFSGDLLIGNFGDGKINAYDPNTGAFKGTLSSPDGQPVVIDGLWGIAFGNDAAGQPHNTLFYAAGTNGEADGSYGRIDTRTVTTGSGPCTGYGC